MDPTTIPPPLPEKSPPPPQNPHSHTAITDASAFDCYQKDEPSTNGNMDTFKALVSKLAARLLPAHKSHIERRLDDIFTDELLVPNHPPYADMILTALWELNTDGGSSEEAISNFILKEYHELPWAHATILNHHLRDLRIKRKIIMTHDGLYQRCLSTTKPLPSQPNLSDSSSSSPISSPSSSSSSGSQWSSRPTSSSSSMDWGSTNKREKKRKRKRKRIKGKIVRVRGRGIGRGRGRGRGRGKGRGRQSTMIQETSDEDEGIDMEVEEDDGGEKQKIHTQEDNNEVVEKGFLVESQTKVVGSQEVEEQNGNGKERGKTVGLRRSGRRRFVVSDEEDSLGAQEENQQQSGAEVVELEDDVINGDGDQVDGHVESSKQEQEEKDARNVEHKEQTQHEKQKTEVNQEPIHQKQEEEEEEEEEEEKDARNVEHKEQAQNVEKETEVNQEPIPSQEQCVEMSNEKLESCGQDFLKNESTEEQPQQEEQDTEANQKESEVVVMETDEQIDPQVEIEVEISEDKNQEEELKKDTEEQVEPQIQLQNQETVTSEHEQSPIKKVLKVVLGLMAAKSGSQKEDTVVKKPQPQKALKESVKKNKKRQRLREGLRSSCNKQEPTPKKQLEHVTPVRRILRSHKTNEDSDIVVEVPEHSKKQVECSGRTRSSKRNSKSSETEQVSKSKKTRRN